MLVAGDAGRVKSDRFMLIHEYLAHMLGTQREGVTAAATAFKPRELIEYSPGEIHSTSQASRPNRARAIS